MATIAPENPTYLAPRSDKVTYDLWLKRIEAGKKERKKLEPTWHRNRAFAAGYQWVKWNRYRRTLGMPEEDQDLERYTADRLQPYIQTFMGLLMPNDPRPDIGFARDDKVAQDFSAATNHAFKWGWGNEWLGDEVLEDIALGIIIDGTAPARCRLDKASGPIIQEQVPHIDGRPSYPQNGYGEAATAYATGDGFELRDVRARIAWDAGSPFNLLLPPGVEYERDFPWEIWVEAQPLDKVKDEYRKAKGLSEDNLASSTMLGIRQIMAGDEPEESAATPGKLEGYVLVYHCFERPSAKYARGRMCVIAGERILESVDELPYRAPDGSYRSGITYFRGIKVKGRFYGKGLIENAIGPQREKNRTRTMERKIIQHGQPYTLVAEGQELKQTDEPLEVVRYTPGMNPPIHVPGINPGEWMARENEQINEDIEAATGIHAGTLGDNPTAVDTYSQLVLLTQKDLTKLARVRSGFISGTKRLSEDTVFLMKRYWPPDKMVAILGEEEGPQLFAFNAAQIPEFYLCEIPEGNARPHDPGAELLKIQEIVQYCLEINQPLSPEWVHASKEAGRALPLPDRPSDDHMEAARWENGFLAQGKPVAAEYYDNPEIHIPEHRSLQIKARIAGDAKVMQLVEDHIQEHLLLAQANAMQMNSMLPQPLPPEQQPHQSQGKAQGQSQPKRPTPTP